MFCSNNRMSFYEVPYYCRVNPSLKRAERHVIDAIVNIRKSVFQTAECGLNEDNSRMGNVSKHWCGETERPVVLRSCARIVERARRKARNDPLCILSLPGGKRIE